MIKLGFEITFYDGSPVYVVFTTESGERSEKIANEKFVDALKKSNMFYCHASGYCFFEDNKFIGLRPFDYRKDSDLDMEIMYLNIFKHMPKERKRVRNQRRRIKRIQRFRSKPYAEF